MRPPIGGFRPLVNFHQPALIIGIGDGGARVIELLFERLQDSQVIAQGAQPIKVDNQPEFLHIAFEKLGCVQLQEPVRSLVVTEQIVAPVQQAQGSAAWRWLTENRFAVNNQQPSRRSARIALFNHLQMSHDPLLFRVLRQKLAQISKVFIVGSALEFAGANLIGDLAALVRLATPNISSITAFVTLEDKANRNLEFAPNDLPQYQTAILYELQRWLSETHRYWRLGDQNALIYNPKGSGLIDRSFVFYGKDNIGFNRAAQCIWAMLTSSGFAHWLDQHVRKDRPHSLTLFYSRTLQWHTRLLRKIYTERLVLESIGEDKTPPRRLEQFNHPEEWLDSVRHAGLLPTLHGLRQRFATGRAATYLDNLIATFRQGRRDAQNFLTQAIKQIDAIDREQERGYFIAPLPIDTWQTVSPPSEAVEALRQCLGWTSSDQTDYPVRMAFQGDAQGRTAFIHEFMPNTMTRYVQKVRELAERIASQYVAREAESLLPSLAEHANRDLVNNWAGYYERLRESFGQHFAGAQVLDYSIVINEPSDEWHSYETPVKFTSDDRIFALQALLVHGVSPKSLRITRNGDQCRLFNTQPLVDLAEVKTFEIFKTLDVDVRLQNALAEPEFKLFGECLVRDCYDDLCEELQLPRRKDITDWLSVLDRFMQQMSGLRRGDIEGVIMSKERLPNDQITEALPNSGQNADLVARAIRSVLNLQIS